MDLPSCVCPLCRKAYNTPRRFPCLHTFCERCIQGYIERIYLASEGTDSDAPKGIGCPTCAKFTKKPDEVSARSWVFSFPLNRIAMTVSQVKCNVCSNEFSMKNATSMCPFCDIFLCADCKVAHDLRNSGHTLIRLDTSEGGKNDTRHCRRHGRSSYSFCREHSVECCDLCVLESHVQCRKIVAVDSVAKDIEIDMLSMQEKLQVLFKKKRSLRNNLQRKVKSSKEKVAKMRAAINDALDRLQNDLFLVLENAEEEESRRVEEVEKKMETLTLNLECMKLSETSKISLHMDALLRSEKDMSNWIEQHEVPEVLQYPMVEINESILEFIYSQSAIGYFTPMQLKPKTVADETMPQMMHTDILPLCLEVRRSDQLLQVGEDKGLSAEGNVEIDSDIMQRNPVSEHQIAKEEGHKETKARLFQEENEATIKDSGHAKDLGRLIQYNRESLIQLQFNTLSLTKPAGLPDIPEITLDKGIGNDHCIDQNMYSTMKTRQTQQDQPFAPQQPRMHFHLAMTPQTEPMTQVNCHSEPTNTTDSTKQFSMTQPFNAYQPPPNFSRVDAMMNLPQPQPPPNFSRVDTVMNPRQPQPLQVFAAAPNTFAMQSMPRSMWVSQASPGLPRMHFVVPDVNPVFPRQPLYQSQQPLQTFWTHQIHNPDLRQSSDEAKAEKVSQCTESQKPSHEPHIQNSRPFSMHEDKVTEEDNCCSQLPIQPNPTSMESIQETLNDLLIDKNADNETVFDWIEENVAEKTKKSKEFIRILMTTVCQSSIRGPKNNQVVPDEIKRRGVVLTTFLGNQVENELQALYALQALVHRLGHPSGVLRILFDSLYDEDIISEDAFNQWEKSTDQAEQEGKPLALNSVTQFFKWLREPEDDSDA